MIKHTIDQQGHQPITLTLNIHAAGILVEIILQCRALECPSKRRYPASYSKTSPLRQLPRGVLYIYKQSKEILLNLSNLPTLCTKTCFIISTSIATWLILYIQAK